MSMLRLALALAVAAAPAAAEDWTDWRGPRRDGTSLEKGLPERWSPAGENLLWRVPYGSRSTPVVVGSRVYLQNWVGEGVTLQERVMALHADTGAVVWEHRFNLYQSETPAHRVGWAAPAADPATGHIFALGGAGHLVALTPAGEVLWERSLQEDFGVLTTHGGRTVSPIVEGDVVMVSGVGFMWAEDARIAHRFYGFDKATGQTLWISSPAGRPMDLTTYSPPIVAEVDGTRLFVAGATDGAVHALKPLTGEPVWRFHISKRGINTGAIVHDGAAIVSHSEENTDSNEMGLLAALPLGVKGDVKKDAARWLTPGFQGGFSSPVTDGARIYQLDNGSNLGAFDGKTGRELWRHNLGTIQKAPLVLADGKLYVGTENGTFYILRPRADGVEVIDQDALGTSERPEIILASVAISGGRIFLPTMDALYAIGPRTTKGAGAARPPAAAHPARSTAPAAALQVVPAEVIASPGKPLSFAARAYDAQGARTADPAGVTFTLEGLKGTVSGGVFTPDPAAGAQAGKVKASAGALSAEARVRVITPLPWKVDFEDLAAAQVPPHWVGAGGKFEARAEGGSTVLVKLANNPFTKRARTYFGPSDLADYTIEVDVLARELRRQMGDAGVIGQRYGLFLFGNHQRVELQPWQPETTRTVTAKYPWKPDTWYRVKLQVENGANGTVTARGKVWPRGEAEPSAWLIERTDPIPNREGAPGLYADVPAHPQGGAEIFFDNLEVRPNR